MKTIKQLSEEIGVSKTAIRKRLTPEVQTMFAETVCGVIYISLEGEKYIKSTFSKKMPETKFAEVCGNQFAHVSDDVSVLIAMLKSELEAKNKQIDEQQQTINKLADTLSAIQQTTQTAQALHAGTIHKQLISETILPIQSIQNEEIPKKGFFKVFKNIIKNTFSFTYSFLFYILISMNEACARSIC